MIQPGKLCGFDLRVEDPGIVVCTFNEPERLNGMNGALKRDLVEVLTQCQMDDAVRVVLFIGSGRAFSAGDDISGHSAYQKHTSKLVPEIFRGHHNHIGTYEGLRIISQPLNTAVRTLDKLTIAAVNGVAIQTGLSLALACDFRVAAKSARLGSATLRFGLLPDEGGQYLLVQHLGVARAMDFLMRKKIATAQEALELGLVNEVVEDAELLPRALDLARELANGPQVAMRLLKRSIYNAAEMTWAQALDEIAAKTAIGDHHPDAREGIAAFREKRPAKFNAWLAAGEKAAGET
jgi:2-(1,2-epoxy-1,2-dihydrophenyl)acetyl-CoA isomerase